MKQTTTQIRVGERFVIPTAQRVNEVIVVRVVRGKVTLQLLRDMGPTVKSDYDKLPFLPLLVQSVGRLDYANITTAGLLERAAWCQSLWWRAEEA